MAVLYLTVVAGLELVVIAGLIVALMLERNAMAELLARLMLQAEGERRELANRIQRPDVLPVTPGQRRTVEPKVNPNLAKIGTFAQQDGE